jgi:hypothetical protein
LHASSEHESGAKGSVERLSNRPKTSSHLG